MDLNHYQQYANFYWHNYPESAAIHWDYPPAPNPMYQNHYQTQGLPGANAAGARRANTSAITKEVVVVDSPTDSGGENDDQPQGDREKSEVGLCACDIRCALIGSTCATCFSSPSHTHTHTHTHKQASKHTAGYPQGSLWG